MPLVPGLSVEFLAQMLRSTALCGRYHVEVRFRLPLGSFPCKLTECVVHRGTPVATAAKRETTLREFISMRSCCVGTQCGQQLQPRIRDVIRQADDTRTAIDWSDLCDELDTIDDLAKSKVATSAVEKLHSSNKDLSTAHGQAKARDATSVQIGYELGQIKRIGSEETGLRLPHAYDSESVKRMAAYNRDEPNRRAKKSTLAICSSST